jgi:GT2 family glycosyltransferase
MGETAIPLDSFEGDAWFRSLLRSSLLEAIDQGLDGVASEQASRSLRVVSDAVGAEAFDIALRNLDHAWRFLPDDMEALAPIYCRLMVLDGRDFEAALRLLQRAMDLFPDPEVAALIATSLLSLQRPEEARTQIETALRAYCVMPGGLLFHAAGEVMCHPQVAAVGWMGRGPDLALVGEIAPHQPSKVLDIRVDGQVDITRLVQTKPGSGRRPFRFELPKSDLTARLEVSILGVPLLGSGALMPRHFALDGRAACDGARIKGWARLGWSPTQTVSLRIEDEHGHRESVETLRVACLASRWPFDIDFNAAGLTGGRLLISAQLPDGNWQALPDSPLLREPAARLADPDAKVLLQWGDNSQRPRLGPGILKRADIVDVIIAVHGGGRQTLACINAVLQTLDQTTRILVVDDATEDDALVAALDAWAADGRIMLLRNPTNQGFVVSVNRALTVNPTHDVILLNSDTLVYGDWLARLRAAAYSGLTVGTVTPLSNNGSIASYPRAEGNAIDADVGAEMHDLASSTHSNIRVEIPVGVGFCLYMRRDCLEDVGALDADVFGAGYGEETDYCLRARQRGWSHRLAADVFVYHAGGLSFGPRRTALLERSQRLLNLRHPGFDGFIDSFLAQDPLKTVRRRLDERRLMAFQGRFVLVLSLALSGGVDRFVAERCRELRLAGLLPLVLKAAEAGSAQRCEVCTDAIEAPNLRYDIPAELPDLLAMLGALPLDHMEIQHFLHLDARLVDAALGLPVPYDVFVHDYAWICPRITLIDGTGRYCGEPALSVCETCVKCNGSSLDEEISVAALRARSAAWLGGARRVFAPSADTVERLQRHFADLKVSVRPHATQVVSAPMPARDSARATVRVALIGAIGEHKGYQVLLACARDARDRRLPLEFVVIGYTEDDARLLETGMVFITGRYSDGEAPHLLRREQPDIAWLPSVWPETWCYTLDYALGTGLPIVAFDVGAIAERLRAVGQGELLALGLEPAHINDRLLILATEQIASARASRSEQRSLPQARDDANNVITPSTEIAMTESAARKPAETMQAPEVTAEEGLGSSIQVLPLPAGLYLFSVKSSGLTAAHSLNQLALPAMHVGLGPGMRSEQVQFMEGAAGHGAWLFAANDQLVAKIAAGGATLFLTSVRAPGGEVLSIKVERLNARLDATLAFSAPVPGVGAPPNSGLICDAPLAANAAANPPLSFQIAAHIRTRGDMIFADAPWAGRIAPGLWIESFSVRPLQQFGAGDIEYKALTGSGFETPWISDDQACGTKGMAVPLVGFALRLKSGPATTGYDCEYSGYFQSGLTVGPLKNGAPCRSTVANDPLEGIQLRLVKHVATGRRTPPRPVACV